MKQFVIAAACLGVLAIAPFTLAVAPGGAESSCAIANTAGPHSDSFEQNVVELDIACLH